MLSSSGPANIAGNRVKTSIFMVHRRRRGNRAPQPSPRRLSLGPLFDEFKVAAKSLFRAAHLQQGPDGMNRRALFADDLPDIGWMKAQFINHRALAFHRRDGDRIGTVDQTFHDVFKERLHRSASLSLNRRGRCRRGRLGGRPGGLPDETGDGVARLGAFAQPILNSLVVEFHILALLQRLIRTEFLDELTITRTATVGHNDPERRAVRIPDPFHAYSHCHKSNLTRFAASTGYTRPGRHPARLSKERRA